MKHTVEELGHADPLYVAVWPDWAWPDWAWPIWRRMHVILWWHHHVLGGRGWGPNCPCVSLAEELSLKLLRSKRPLDLVPSRLRLLLLHRWDQALQRG
jgi:hypothetical protein